MSEEQASQPAQVESNQSVENNGQQQPQQSAPKQPEHHARSFAALMRREREVTQKAQEAKQDGPSLDDLRVMAKSKPLEALQQLGIDYDYVTQAALNDGKVEGGEIHETIHGLQQHIQQLEAKLNKYEEKGQQSEEEAAWGEVRSGLSEFVAQDKEKYKLLNSTDGATDFALQVMRAAYEQTAAEGNPYIPSYEEVAEHVEKSLLEDARKAAQAAGLWTPEEETPAEPPKQASPSSSLSQELTTTVPTGRNSDSLDHHEAIKRITEKHNFFK